MKHLVDNNPSSSDSDTNIHDVLEMMESSQPGLKLVAYSKIKKLVESYSNQELTRIDK